jgi:hypothetical protein
MNIVFETLLNALWSYLQKHPDQIEHIIELLVQKAVTALEAK